MNITQESVTDFVVGSGGASAAGDAIIAPGYIRKAYKGVRVRAATANTLVIYVGPAGVTTSTGYPLPAGEELSIPIEDPSKVCVAATPAANQQQTITLAGDIPGDTFTLTFRGETTTPIATNANAAAVQSALVALSTIGTGNCTVADTGGADPYTATFVGALAKHDVDVMTGIGSGVNEKQTVAIDDATSSGTFTLTYSGQTTTPIAFDATATAVATALKALSNIADDEVVVTGGPGPAVDWVVEFTGAKALTDIAAMSGTGTSLVGGSTDVTITETQKGDATCTVTVAKVADITAASKFSWIAV